MAEEMTDYEVQHEAHNNAFYQLQEAVLEKHSFEVHEKLPLAKFRDRILLLAALRGLVLSSPDELTIDMEVHEAFIKLVESKLRASLQDQDDVPNEIEVALDAAIARSQIASEYDGSTDEEYPVDPDPDAPQSCPAQSPGEGSSTKPIQDVRDAPSQAEPVRDVVPTDMESKSEEETRDPVNGSPSHDAGTIAAASPVAEPKRERKVNLGSESPAKRIKLGNEKGQKPATATDTDTVQAAAGCDAKRASFIPALARN